MGGLGEVVKTGWAKPCFKNFLYEKQGYMNTDAYGSPPPSLKLQSFLDSKHLHSAWALADVASI